MIYVLEDDESIRELIIYTLNGQSMEARGFAAPSEFWAAMSEKTPSLVLLDIMLPEEDGFSILQKLRAAPATKRLPIIMLTAKGSEYDIVRGLDIGADDYIPKPFRMMELLSRIRALLRRSGGDNGKMEEYRVGNLYVNPIKHVVEVDGKEVILTLKEFELLSLLISRQGIVFTRAQLLDEIWGYGFDGESRTVDVHIRTLFEQAGVQVAVAVWIFLQVLLVVFLRRVEVGQRQAFDSNRLVVVLAQLLQLLADHRLLCRVGVVDTGAVLAAAVPALPVDRGGVDGAKVKSQQLCQRELLAVVHHPHRLGVASVVVTDLLIAGVFGAAVGKADLGFQHAVDLVQILLGSPEAPARQIDCSVHRISFLSQPYQSCPFCPCCS